MRMLLTASALALIGAAAAPANAMPFPSLADQAPSAITLTAGGCGVGFHRGPYGGCRPNGGYGVVGVPAYGYGGYGYGHPGLRVRLSRRLRRLWLAWRLRRVWLAWRRVPRRRLWLARRRVPRWRMAWRYVARRRLARRGSSRPLRCWEGRHAELTVYHLDHLRHCRFDGVQRCDGADEAGDAILQA